MKTHDHENHGASRGRRSLRRPEARGAAFVVVGLTLGCGQEPQPTPDDPEAVLTVRVNTARGPATLAYVDIDGWAVADGDIVLGRTERLQGQAFRDVHVGTRIWPNGIIPYVWDIYTGFPNSLCAWDEQKFCGGETLFYEKKDSVWRRFIDAVARETSLSLVNASNCYYEESCRQKYMTDPGSYVFIRRPWLINGEDNTQICDSANSPQQITVITFGDVTPGPWNLEIKGESFTVVGGEDPEEIAADLEQAILNWQMNHDLPVAIDVDGAVMTLTSTNWESMTVRVTSPGPDEFTLETTQFACKGAKGCPNTDCPSHQVCVATWPYPDWDKQHEGFCQGAIGQASLGPHDPDHDEMFLSLPLAWFHGENLPGMGHELLHAAGFIHEQQRPDAAVAVINPTCLLGSLGNFGPHPEADLYGWAGPVDFASTMMYSSANLCSPDPPCENQCLSALEGVCPEEVCGVENPSAPDFEFIKLPGWFEGYEDFGKGITDKKIHRGWLGLSYGDQDALRLYAGDAFAQAFVEGICPWYPDNGDGLPMFAYSGIEPGDHFGAALALGQFGDENHAIIVGSPGESEDYLDIASGAATVWEATIYTEELAADGLDPLDEDDNAHVPALPSHAAHQFLVPQPFESANTPPQNGDRFGVAVVAVDLDGDGIDEIAVGAPEAGINHTGAVYIYKTGSSKRKHTPWKVLYPSDPSTRDFGSALAAGNFARGPSGGDCDDLREELAVGAPDGTAAGTSHGSVVVFRYAAGDVTAHHTILPPVVGPPQRFGQALVAADLNGDGQDGLVVGAPQYLTDSRGRAYFYEQQTIPTDCAMPFDSVLIRTGSGSNARFGSALAAGDLLRGTNPAIAGIDDVAVGAPGTATRAGYVDVIRGTPSGPVFFAQIKQSALANPNNLDYGDDPVGDEFGAALAIVSHTSTSRPAYLFAGAPGEVVDGHATGTVYQLRFPNDVATADHVHFGGIRETSECAAGEAWGCGLSTNYDNDWSRRFGAALAADDRVVVMGDPDYDYFRGDATDVGAGAIRIYVRERDPDAPDAWRLMRRQLESQGWPSHEGPGYILPPLP